MKNEVNKTPIEVILNNSFDFGPPIHTTLTNRETIAEIIIQNAPLIKDRLPTSIRSAIDETTVVAETKLPEIVVGSKPFSPK